MRTTATLIVIVAVLANPFAVRAQEAERFQTRTFSVSRTKECTDCHFDETNKDRFDQSRDFCNVEAANTWKREDKHSRSLALLLTGEGRALTEKMIGGLLADVLQFEIQPLENAARDVWVVRNVRFTAPPGDPQAAAKYTQQVATLKQCFACHAPVEEPIDGDGFTTLEHGVSCQACHGASGTYRRIHFERPWRLVKAADKREAFGMVDLRNPVTRIKLCASCHVGSLESRAEFSPANAPRFVRHEWYAQGHPPLPGLEFVTFAVQQPAHWRTIREKLFLPGGFRYYSGGADAEALAYAADVLEPKNRTLAENYRAANPTSFSANPTPDDNPTRDMARAKEVLISGLGVLATYAELVGAVHAKGVAAGPEFALYDCTACHHELRSDFPTQVRVRRPGLPGRPPPAFWTIALARLGAAQASTDLEPAISKLDAAFSARPFGDPELMQTAAKALADQCWAAARELSKQPLDDKAANHLLVRLVYPAHDVDRDYHATRQYAWAIREVMKDLAGVPHRNYTLLADAGIAGPPQTFVPQPLVSLLGGVQGARVPAEHEEVRRRIDAIFDKGSTPMPGAVNWHMPLRLKLPAGQEQQVIANLPDWLAAIATYDSDEFRAALAPLQRAYPLP